METKFEIRYGSLSSVKKENEFNFEYFIFGKWRKTSSPIKNYCVYPNAQCVSTDYILAQISSNNVSD